MWNLDAQTVVQILVIVLVIGVSIIQVLYRNFVKPLAEAEARRRRMEPGKDPTQTLRDFLAELRGEVPPRPQEPAAPPPEPAGAGPLVVAELEPEHPGPPARRPPEAAPGELVWEAAEDADAARAQRPEPAPRQRVRDRAERQARKRKRQAERAAADEEEARASARVGGVLPSQVEEHLSTTFAQVLGGHVRAATPEETGRAGARRALLPVGIGLREAILAQAILGRPRSKETWHASRGRRGA